MANIKCGNCKGYHESVAAVRECHAEAVAEVKPANGNPATAKQIDFLRKLIAERYEDSVCGNFEQCYPLMSKADASKAIETMLNDVPKLATPQSEAVEIEDGVYLKDGHYLKVVHAIHGSGHQYAKVLVPSVDEDGKKVFSWEYLGKAPLATLSADDKLDTEQAKEFGLLYGCCINCARGLTRDESIYVGYGKTCAKNNGWFYPTKKELASLTAVQA